jgi:hypothetical protein
MRYLSLLAVAYLMMAGALCAQQPAPPMLAACGSTVEGVDILCGVRGPEDIEVTPDGKGLLTTQFVNLRDPNAHAGIAYFDLDKKTFTELTATSAPDKAWGDPACPGPIGNQLASHGSTLVKRANGAWQYFVTNHGGRQSVEMFELKRTGTGKDAAWGLIWHGCVVTQKDYNDVAALADGSFVATHPTALTEGGPIANLFDGHPSGYVTRWTPAKGEVELPGTRWGYPNGVIATPDGRTMYYAAWTGKEIHKYDLRAGKDETVVKLPFMPDNVSWTGGANWSAKSQILAAGIKSTANNCGAVAACNIHFGVAQLSPADLKLARVFESGDRAVISGVSSALQVKGSVYIGAFQGDRLVRMDWK